MNNIVGEVNFSFFKPGQKLFVELILKFFCQGVPAFDFSNEGEGVTACTDVSFSIPVGFEGPVDAGQQHVVPDIELPFIV